MAAASALTLVAAACSTSPKPTAASTPRTRPSTTANAADHCPQATTIGFFGPVTGNSPALGTNQADAVQLAISQFDAAHRACQVQYKAFDTYDATAQTTALAQTAVGDTDIDAIVGPTTTAEADQAEPVFNAAGLPTITASATDPSLASNHWASFHRALANSNAQGPAIAGFIIGTLKAKKVAIISDTSAYGTGLADIVRQQLLAAGLSLVSPGPINLSHNYPATVAAVKAGDVDTVFYAGYATEAGPLRLQLKHDGVEATFVSDDGSLDNTFVQTATPAAADGAYLTGPAAIALTQPQDQGFVSAYTAKFGTPPGLYSGEAYDATNQILAAILAGNYTRTAINNYINTTPYTGLLKTYAYATDGELKGKPVILVNKVVNGQITLIGPIATP